MSATTLATLRDRVELMLADSGNSIFAAGDVDEAIRRALHTYSLANPLHKITTLTLAADGRELSTAAITDAIGIDALWCPYTASDPEYPAHGRAFRFWKDASLIYILGQYQPKAGDVARVFYSALHTIDDLDSASVTSVPPEHDSILVGGAAGQAAMTRALDLAEQVTVDRDAVDRLTKWAHMERVTFGAELTSIAITCQTTGHVPMPALDRWDDAWA